MVPPAFHSSFEKFLILSAPPFIRTVISWYASAPKRVDTAIACCSCVSHLNDVSSCQTRFATHIKFHFWSKASILSFCITLCISSVGLASLVIAVPNALVASDHFIPLFAKIPIVAALSSMETQRAFAVGQK